MTPLAFAQDLVADLIRSYPLLPKPAHAQLGDLVVDCAGVYATILNLTEFALSAGTQNCGFVTLADLAVVVAHDCANVSNDNGTTNWEAQDPISAAMDADSMALWDWSEKQRADAFVPTTPPTITFMITGGVASTTLSVQLPVP